MKDSDLTGLAAREAWQTPERQRPRQSIDIVKSGSPLVRVIREDDFEMLMDELQDLRGERADVLVCLRETYGTPACFAAAQRIERGEHRRMR